MLKLRFKNNALNAVWLVEPKVSLGSAADSDLVLSDPLANEHHADVLVEHEKISLRLIQESGETYINDQRINPSKAYPLSLNDVIRVGEQELQLVDPKQEPRPSAEAASTNTGWALKSNSAALSNRVYPLSNSMVVGRSNECDITLAAAHLSRRHASLQVRNGLLYVKDLGSSNGTFLNGKKVAEARVKRGDELSFDTLSFGVIGPSDELDKTTVRSVTSAKPLPAASGAAVSRPQKEQPQRETSVVRKSAPNKVAANREALKKKLEQQQVSMRGQSESSAEAPSSSKGLLIGGLVIVAVVGAWVAIQLF